MITIVLWNMKKKGGGKGVLGEGGNTSLHVQHISLHIYTYQKNV